MANVLTAIRVICGVLILLFPADSRWYYFIYLLGGFSDAIDGTVARRTGKASDFGAKFDTVADIVFVLAVLIKVMLTIDIPFWILIWIGIIVVFKAVNVLIGFIKYREFVAVHSVMNKVCGVAVFILPLIIGLDVIKKRGSFFSFSSVSLQVRRQYGKVLKFTATAIERNNKMLIPVACGNGDFAL